MKSWVLNGDVLEIKDGAKCITASADDVYRSVLEGTPAWPDLIGGKCGAANNIRFARYPVDLHLVILTDTSSGKPSISIRARTQEGISFLPSMKALSCGHVIHEGTWYPIERAASDEVLALMGEAGLTEQHGMPTTLKGLMCLRKAAIEGSRVVDQAGSGVFKYFLSEEETEAYPKGIEARLYPYQLDGWKWLRLILREQLGGLLADEMGLGKTLQVISALRDPGGDIDSGEILVVAPGSLLENWAREIKRFCPDFVTCKHQGPMRTGSPTDLSKFDIVVTSYDTLVRDLSLLKMIEWKAVILDEAQNIRNPGAIRTKSAKQLRRKVGLAVTGTPIENRLRDLWSIMDFAVPGHLGTLSCFEARYVDEVDTASLLEPLVSPLMLRRRVAEVAADLPNRIDIPEFIEMSEPEASAYERIRRRIFEDYGEAATLVSLGKLRQFCAHPATLGNSAEDFSGLCSSKFERLMEILEEIFSCNEKVLIFTSYTKMADLISSMLNHQFGVMAATLDGRLPMDKRQHLIDLFSTHQGPGALVLNPRAGGAGLNITAANHVIHYNPEWNPALEDQASARAHRRGQQRPVTVRRLIYTDTIEEAIDERLRRKRAIAEAAILGSEGQVSDYMDILNALERSPFNGEARY